MTRKRNLPPEATPVPATFPPTTVRIVLGVYDAIAESFTLDYCIVQAAKAAHCGARIAQAIIYDYRLDPGGLFTQGNRGAQ